MRWEVQSVINWQGVNTPSTSVRVRWVNPKGDCVAEGFSATRWGVWQAHPQPTWVTQSGVDWLYLPFPEEKPVGGLPPIGLAGVARVEVWRNLAASVWNQVKGFERVFLDLTSLSPLSPDASLWEAFSQGLELASYEFAAQAGLKPLKSVVLEIPMEFLPSAQKGQIKGYWQNQARHLINLPANVATVKMLKQGFWNHSRVQKWASQGAVSWQEWDRPALEEAQARLLCAVGDSGRDEPALVKLGYQGGGLTDPWVALVGKGVVFDSGGLDIKPASAMRLMKKDMAGAATVWAVTMAAVELGLPVNVEAWMPLAENNVDSRSFRPMDVYQSAAGHWVEIQNTDAEGRLLLADAMALAQKHRDYAFLIDVATLTGAMRYALGLNIAGLLGNHEPLLRQLWEISWQQGDYFWLLPLFEPYRQALTQTPFADFQSATEGMGSSITAAWFLHKFIQPGVRWAHVDMYAWADQSQGAMTQAGANGQSFNALLAWLQTNLTSSL